MLSDSFSRRFGLWVCEHRWLTLLLSLIVVLAATAGIVRNTFSNDYRAFFGEDNPQLQAFDELEKAYTKSDNVMFIVAPKDNSVFSAKTLVVVEDLTEQAWQLPYSIRVDSLSNFQHSYSEQDDMFVEDLIEDASALSAEDLKRIEDVVMAEPRLVGQIISTKKHVTGVNVTMQLPGLDPNAETPETVSAARELADVIRGKYPDVDIHVTGVVMMNNAFAESSMKDMATLIPLGLVLIIITLGIALRGWTGTFATFWVIILSIGAGMGMTGWFGIVLTPASASAPTIIVTMAVADSVHVLATFFSQYRQTGSRLDAMVESLRINLQPIFLTTLTTIIGFMSLNFSDSPPFRDLGNIVSMGVAFAFFLSVTLLPALMMILPVRQPAQLTRESALMEKFADLVIRFRTPLLYGMGVFILVLVSFVPRNELNDVFVEYFDDSIEFRRASDFADQNLSGLYRIDYSLRTNEEGAVNDPEFMRQTEAFAQWYRQQTDVTHVSSYTDMLKKLNYNMHGDEQEYYRVPQERELAAQYMLLYEMQLPYGLDLNNQLNVDKSATKISVSTRTMSVKKLLALEQSAQAWIKDNAPLIKADGSGPPVMFSHITRRNINSMIIGTSIALVLISALLVVALRSLKMGAISLIPNLIPAAMAFGLWGILVGQIGLSTSIVAGMTLGIVVDDTVHFLSKYLRARRERGLSSPDAVRYAFNTVGMALVITSIVLAAGFLVLTFSSFRLNSGMGLLTAITIMFALLADFLFLPPLLMKIEGDDNDNEETAAGDRIAGTAAA